MITRTTPRKRREGSEGLDDLAVLVIDVTHPRFGQMGRLTVENIPSGCMGVVYSDGKRDSFKSEEMGIDIYRAFNDEMGVVMDEKNGIGPECLARDYLDKFNHKVEEFKRDYRSLFGREFPRHLLQGL